MSTFSHRLVFALVVATIATPAPGRAQSGRMTAAEYDRAVNLLGPNLTGLAVPMQGLSLDPLSCFVLTDAVSTTFRAAGR